MNNKEEMEQDRREQKRKRVVMRPGKTREDRMPATERPRVKAAMERLHRAQQA